MSKWNELKKLMREKIKEGWSVEPTGKGHFRWTRPADPDRNIPSCLVYTAGTPRSDSAMKKIRHKIEAAEQNRTVKH